MERKSGFSKLMSRLSNFGMDYSDLIIKNQNAVKNVQNYSNGYSQGNGSVDDTYDEWSQFGRLNSSDSFTRKSISYFNQSSSQKRNELRRYSQQDEIEEILDTLCDECIVYNDENFFCQPSHFKDSSIDDKQLLLIQEAITENFKRLYIYWGFNDDVSAWQYFRKFLIEGYLAFEIVYSKDNKSIIGFVELDAISLVPFIKENQKFWISDRGSQNERVLYDSQILYISYGQNNIYGRVSYVERLIRSFNLMRLMEHSRIIWAVVNASYRTKFIIPVGGKSKNRQKQSLAALMQSYKENIDFAEESGELKVNGKPMMPFNREYWFPETESGTPQMETVGNDGADLSDTESLKYFRNKLIRVSKIPFSRFDSEGGQGTYSNAAEGLARDEIKFGRFVNRLRSAFQEILTKPLWLQMCIDFPELANDQSFKAGIGINYHKINVFEETKEIELFQKRAEFIKSINDNITELNSEGDERPYFSQEFLVRKFLQISNEDLKLNRKFKILDEKQKKAKENETSLGNIDDAGYEGGTTDPFQEDETKEIPTKEERLDDMENSEVELPEIPNPTKDDNLEADETPKENE